MVKEIKNKVDKGEEDTTSNTKTHNEIQEMIKDIKKFEEEFKEYEGIEIEEDEEDEYEDIELEDVESYPASNIMEESESIDQELPEEIVEPISSEGESEWVEVQPKGRITGIQQLKQFAELNEVEQQEELYEPEEVTETDEEYLEPGLQELDEPSEKVDENLEEKKSNKKEVKENKSSNSKPGSSAVFNVGFSDDGKLVNLDVKKSKPKKIKEKSETEGKSSKFKGGLGKLKRVIPFKGKEE